MATRDDFLSLNDLRREYYLMKLGLTDSNYSTQYLKQLYWETALDG